MAKKRDLLAKLSRENLIALAVAYDVEIDRSRPKVDLVEALANSHRLKTEGLVELSTRIAALGDVPAALYQSRQGYFEETAIAAFDQIDALADTLSVAVAAYDVIDPGYSQKLTGQIAQLRGSKIQSAGSVPDHVWSQLSGKQRAAYGVAKSLSYQIPNFLDGAISSSRDTDLAQRARELEARRMPAKTWYYVSQSYRSYVAGCYDSSIVMLARALEHLLRNRLYLVPVSIEPKATLGRLVDLYKKSVGNDACLEKILEVANMDRIVSAHDVPPFHREMEKRDADHAWTAFEIVAREIPVKT